MSLSATYRVRVNWTGNTLDWSGPNADVTADVQDFTVKIGRNKLQDTINAGQLDLTFLDKGKYNPYNSSSVLYGNLLPMRAVIVDASLDGGGTWPYVLFQGWSRTGTSNPDYGTTQATLHAEDLLMRLSRSYPIIAEMGATTVGAALQAVLTAIGWTGAVSLATGDNIAHFVADGSVDALTLCQDLMSVAQGMFFQAPNGTATFFDRNYWASRTSLGTIVLAQSTIPGYDLDSVINKAVLTAPGGSPQTASDAGSIASYGENDFGGLGDASYLTGDLHASDLANYIVTNNAQPNDRVWGVTVSEGPAGYMPIMLGCNLLDDVTLATPSISGDFLIQSIQHQGKGGALHRTTWGLSVRPSVGFMILDTAPGLDTLGMTY